jgi:hypothetical protein
VPMEQCSPTAPKPFKQFLNLLAGDYDSPWGLTEMSPSR